MAQKEACRIEGFISDEDSNFCVNIETATADICKSLKKITLKVQSATS